ncbi:hypothetical protein Nepgr_006867 [Nepenthes gracilis]|uniref:Uncharacterized protein n=1 Tax=Nepenthes gracilis TaxID=150966 RepID=A0AAD3S6M2_NEPGR|nr:hypothetical protein Nepgr_006867 [Nepenthes gracilis]
MINFSWRSRHGFSYSASSLSSPGHRRWELFQMPCSLKFLCPDLEGRRIFRSVARFCGTESLDSPLSASDQRWVIDPLIFCSDYIESGFRCWIRPWRS